MAKYLLEKHPNILLGGLGLEDGELRCQDFWNKFKEYQPTHVVFDHYKDSLGQVIPICLHGDKGRTLKKSPVAVYSWESVWGLPSHLRRLASDRPLNNRGSEQKHDKGMLGQSCSERPAWREGDGAGCTIKRRRLGEHPEEKTQTHNSLGYLGLIHMLKFLGFHFVSVSDPHG